MSPRSRAMVWTGIAYLVTFASSIPALILLTPLIDNPHLTVAGPLGPAPRIGGLLDVVNALACVASAVAIYPLARELAPARAIGFVASRVVEGSVVLAGVAALLAVAAMSDDATASDSTATALMAVRNGTFLLGPGLMAGINALVLGSIVWQSRLVPRWIPAVGLVGAPLHLAAVASAALGYTTQTSALASLAAAPIALWEFSLAVALVATALHERTARRQRI